MKNSIKNLDKRKVIGTVVGGIVFICCMLYFTYAFYNWRSTNTIVDLTIEDISGGECIIGPDVDAVNIGPVLNVQDGVIAEFSVSNDSSSATEIALSLDITSIHEDLREPSFKYALVQNTGSGYNYDSFVLEGNFENVTDNQTLVLADTDTDTTDIPSITIDANSTYSYQFIVYIDGSVYNPSSMQSTETEIKGLYSKLMVGDCGSLKTTNIFTETILQPNAYSDKDIDFSKSSKESNTNGIYLRSGTENDKYPIYYYRGNVNNNLIFADFCWKIVRTTETGGLKLIYNGLPTNGQCNNTGVSSQIGTSKFNENQVGNMFISAFSDVSYMYLNRLIIQGRDMTNTTDIYYGNDVIYENGVYTLTDTITNSDWSTIYNGGLNNNHYTCFSNELTCDTVYYIYSTSSSSARYVELSGGEKIDDFLAKMLGNDDTNVDSYNIVSSTIKGNSTTEGTIDYWYYTNIEQEGYSDYVEDTVWCNDRNIYQKGGFEPDGGDTTNLEIIKFDGYVRLFENKPNLACSRNVDKFTVSEVNGNGDLDYPVGLLTSDEVLLAGAILFVNDSSHYLYTGQTYWLGTPIRFDITSGCWVTNMNSDYGHNTTNTYAEIGIRPAISLKPGFKLTGNGDGSVTTPYVVE